MKKLILLLPGLCCATLLLAQEETPKIAPANPITTRTTLAAPPERRVTVVPKITAAQAATPAEVRLYLRMNPAGYVNEARIHQSANPALDELSLEAARQWRFEPAQLNGAIVGGSFIQPISIGDGLFFLAANFSAKPRVSKRVAPVLNDTQQYLGGHLIVAVQLDNIGRKLAVEVVSSTEEELNAPTISAVSQWTFTPAYVNDKAAPTTVYIPFDYVARQRTGDLSKAITVDGSQLQPLRQPSPRLPGALADVNAEAIVELVIDQRGFVAKADVVSTNNAEVGELARQSALKWRYVPVVRDGHPVAVKVRQPFRFGDGAVSIATVDQPLKIKTRVAPEMPRALEGTSGFANVVVEVDATGKVSAVEVRECSHEEFKEAVTTAVRKWTFTPALRAGAPVSSRVAIPFVFGRK